MNHAFLRVILLLHILLICNTATAQKSTLFSNIHPLEPTTGHYEELSKISQAEAMVHAFNSIPFPKENYSEYALMFTMATPAYLTKGQIDQMISGLSHPPSSSRQTRAELNHLLKWQEKRTPEQVERVLYLAKIGYWPAKSQVKSHPEYESNLEDLLFECQEVIGENCTAKNYPKTTALLQGVTLDMRIMEFTLKYHLLRPRPYHLEKRLEPLQVLTSPSFASGHTLWAYIHAYTFSELMPEKRADFLEIAAELALSREIMGVHYPSDNETARQLAHQMLSLMWQNADFQKDFEAAKAEWE